MGAQFSGILPKGVVKLMETLHIGPIQISEDGHKVETEFRLGPSKYNIYYKCADTTLAPKLESFIMTALIPSMKRRLAIRAEGEVGPSFLGNIEKAQDVIRGWKPNYGRVEIKGVHPAAKPAPGGERVGVFFSAGLDSFYSFIKNKDEISDLIFVHGFDMLLDDRTLRGRMSKNVRGVGVDFKKRVIEVETNARQFLDEYVTWGFTHGTVLGGIANLLAPQFRRIYISASRTYGRVTPYGVHPDLDPNWGAEGLDLIHEGLEAWRWEKAAVISEHDAALKSLRVCLWSPENHLNCGNCEKCVTSMVFLRTAGSLDRCTTFEVPLDLDLIPRRTKFTGDPADTNLGKCLEQLEAEDRDPELAEALRKTLYRPGWQKATIKQVRSIRKKLSKRLQR